MTMIQSRHTDPKTLPTPDRLEPQGLSRRQRVLRIGAMVLLFLSALPDAMVVPVLHQLMVERYGVSAAAAHAFMCVNLLGALVKKARANQYAPQELFELEDGPKTFTVWLE